MGCVPHAYCIKSNKQGIWAYIKKRMLCPEGCCFSYRQEMLLYAVVCCCVLLCALLCCWFLEGKDILGDGLGSLFCQLPNSSSHPPAQL